MVPVDVLRDELPEVEVLAQMEGLNPGGALKDRPVVRMLLSAQLVLTDAQLGYDEALREVRRTVLTCDSSNAGERWARASPTRG